VDRAAPFSARAMRCSRKIASHMRRWALAGCTVWLGASLAWPVSAEPVDAHADGPFRFAPFECAPGLTHRAVHFKDSDGRALRSDSCVDSAGRGQGLRRYTLVDDDAVENEAFYADGKLHGVSRMYDALGFLTTEIEYERGTRMAERNTVRGMQKIAAIANEKFQTRGKVMKFVVVDAERMRFVFLADPSRLQPDSPRLRQTLARGLCPLMSDAPQVRQVEVQAISDEGRVLRSIVVQPSACGKARAAR
jgi:hypothetical protein